MPRITYVASAHDKLELDELEPFDPPDDFQFEPELLAPAPRSIPDEVLRLNAESFRRTAIICVAIGGLTCLAGALPFVRLALASSFIARAVSLLRVPFESLTPSPAATDVAMSTSRSRARPLRQNESPPPLPLRSRPYVESRISAD